MKAAGSHSILCPRCNRATKSRTIDCSTVFKGEKIRRRRECVPCGHRFTTFEFHAA